jgi:hypothetical protein
LRDLTLYNTSMTLAPAKDLSSRALAAVQQVASLRQTAKGWPAEHSNKVALLAVKSWQAQRLATTYADLLGNPRYVDAANFFLNDLYGAHDLSVRDDEVKRMLPSLVKLLPNSALRTVVEALEMDALSEQLDHDLANVLQTYSPNLTGMEAEMAQAYAHCYRNMPSLDRRAAQIAMVAKIGHSLDKLVRQPMLGGLLAAMSGPAKIAGLSSVYDFLWRGFSAFKKMKGAKEFLEMIEAREIAEHKRLLA